MTIKSLQNGKASINGQIFNNGSTGVRQTIQYGLTNVSTGECAITQTSLTLQLTLLASTEPVVVHCAGGAMKNDRMCEFTSNQILNLPASSTVYCYVEIDENGNGALGYTTLAPIYQAFGTPSMVNGQFTFNINEMKAYVGIGGTSYVQVWRTFFQQSVTSSTAITSVINYALNGKYISPLFGIALSSTYTNNHNIGCNFIANRTALVNISAEGGFEAGEEIEMNAGGYNEYNVGYTSSAGRLTCSTIVSTSVAFSTLNKTTKTYLRLTLTNWKFKQYVDRSF